MVFMAVSLSENSLPNIELSALSSRTDPWDRVKNSSTCSALRTIRTILGTLAFPPRDRDGMLTGLPAGAAAFASRFSAPQ